MNRCVECGASFLATESLWLFCDACESSRRLRLLTAVDSVLATLESDPDLAPDRPAIAERRFAIAAEVYDVV